MGIIWGNLGVNDSILTLFFHAVREFNPWLTKNDPRDHFEDKARVSSQFEISTTTGRRIVPNDKSIDRMVPNDKSIDERLLNTYRMYLARERSQLIR